MCDICGIDKKSIDDGKVWVRIRGTNPTVQKPVSEIQYDTMIPAVIFRYKGERCRRIVAIINLDIMIKDWYSWNRKGVLWMGFSKDLKEIIMMRMALKEKKRQEEEAERRWAAFISVLFFAAIMVCFFIMMLFENLGIIRWEGEALKQISGPFLFDVKICQ